MMNKLCFAFILVSIISTSAFAQQEDFNTWYNVSLKGNLYKKIDFSIEPQIRLFENSRQLSSWQTEINLSTGFRKWLDLGGAYRYQVEYDNPLLNERVHRWAFYSKFSFNTNKLKWAYRAQIQSEQVNINSSPDGDINYVEHRHKFAVKYKNKKWFIEPSVGIEYYISITPEKDKGEWKNRYYISLNKSISKRISATIAYKRQEEFNRANPDITNIIYFGFEYEPKFLRIRTKKKDKEK